MMPRMKQARTRTNGVGSPSFHQPLPTAMLRAFVALVQSVASTFQMKRNHPPPDWRTGPAEALLPRMKTDTQQQETNSAIQHDGPSALILSSTQSVRPSNRAPSNHESVRTHIAPGRIPPLGKERPACRRRRNPGGDHFVPHSLAKLPTQVLTASESDLPPQGGGETALA